MENEQIVQSSKIIDVDIEREMKKSFLDYSMSVIVSRALPDVRDGLKPVHRRILYSQYEDNLTPDKPYKKCATTVGNVLGRYHPHGDSSVYDALVRLAQDFSMRYTLVDGHGNFGSVDGDPPAAYRYTESKMSKISVEMLTDIDKETVDFIPNYDDSRKEPSVLPSRFPNLLVNGSTGIAVGMATNIPPHNLGEVIDAVNYVIDNPDASLDDIMKYIKGPDFPTAGIIMGQSGIKAAYGTGRGKITVRAKAEIADDKNGKSKIIVTELPYQVNKARLVEAIADMVKDKRIEGISNIDDHSDRNGMHIEISLKREASPNVVLNSLYRNSQMQITYGIIMLAIVNGEPKILTLKDILRNYIDFQVDVITRRTIFDLRKAEERAHILEGLKIAIDFIDEVIRIIRSSKDQPTARHALSERFGLDDAQTQAIVSMRLGQLSGLEREKIEEELTALINKIADFKDILSNGERLLGIIKTELNAIRSKFSDERRTQIESVSGEVDIEDLIPKEESFVTYTKGGYIKRTPISEYHAQKRGGKGVTGMKQREDDYVEEMYTCSTHDFMLFISNKGIMYKLKCYELPEGSKASRGTNIVNILPLENDEKIAAMIKTDSFEDGRFIVMVTKNGKIKRTPLSSYKNVRKNGLRAIGLDEGDEIEGVRMTSGKNQLIIATHNGYAIRVNETDIREMSRTAHGVKAIKLRDGDYVVSMARVRDGAAVLTVAENGLGRRVALENYRIQRRGGYGMMNYKNGGVCGIKVVDDEDDIIMISTDGVVIRIRACDISIMGRYSKGVRLMRVSEDGKVVAFTRTEHEEDAEISEVEQASAEDIAQAAEEEANEVVAEDTAPDDEDAVDDGNDDDE